MEQGMEIYQLWKGSRLFEVVVLVHLQGTRHLRRAGVRRDGFSVQEITSDPSHVVLSEAFSTTLDHTFSVFCLILVLLERSQAHARYSS